MQCGSLDGMKDNGQKLLIALVVLSLVASIIMLFTGNQGVLKLALLAALWAAVLGFFLVGRYRAQAEALEQRVKEQETLAHIREQVEQVRAQLENLTGQVFVEPTMIQAQATRIPEIEQASDQEKAEELRAAAFRNAVASETNSFAKVDWVPTQPEPHGRRRREERSDSVSVADLLKRNR